MTTTTTTTWNAAKKAARKTFVKVNGLLTCVDCSAAHSAAKAAVLAELPEKGEQFAAEFGWQAVLAAR